VNRLQWVPPHAGRHSWPLTSNRFSYVTHWPIEQVRASAAGLGSPPFIQIMQMTLMLEDTMRTVVRFRALATLCVLIAALGLTGCPDNHFDGGTGGASSGGGGGAASLTALVLSAGTLNPTFSTGTTSYSTMVVNTSSLTVTPTATGGTLTVNGVAVVSGSPSGAITLTPGSNTITVVLTNGGSP
jgi:hypothetical protein